MRIKEIRIYGKPLPVRGGAYRMASASVEHLDSTIVEIEACSVRGKRLREWLRREYLNARDATVMVSGRP